MKTMLDSIDINEIASETRSGTKRIPPDGEEPTTGSLNVTSTSLPSMPAAAMNKNVQGAILPARACKFGAEIT